jgi:zinc protease
MLSWAMPRRARIRVAILAFQGLALSIPCQAVADPLNLPVEEHRLANQLEVVLAPDDSVPDVSIVVRYAVGSADDPDGLEGLAHLVEHLEFGGSAHAARGDHTRWLEQAGGSNFIGQTHLDFTIYSETVPPEALDLALWLESDRMGFLEPRLDETAERHEQTIISHEYREHVLDTPFARLPVFVTDEVFPAWHPYHAPTDGLAAIDRLRLRDVKAFLRTWYSPANARLVLAGHFDPEAALALVTRYFGALPSNDVPKRAHLPTSWPIGDVVLDVNGDVPHEFVEAAWLTPALRQPGDRELDLAARLLAGPDGILVHDLVASGLAVSVRARQASCALASEFFVSAQVGDGQSAETVGRHIEAALAKLAAGVDEAQVARARKWWTDVRLLGIETSYGRARRLAEVEDFTDPWDLAAYNRIDAAAVADAVRRFLVPQERVAAIVYPARSRPRVVHREKRLP